MPASPSPVRAATTCLGALARSLADQAGALMKAVCAVSKLFLRFAHYVIDSELERARMINCVRSGLGFRADLDLKRRRQEPRAESNSFARRRKSSNLGAQIRDAPREDVRPLIASLKSRLARRPLCKSELVSRIGARSKSLSRLSFLARSPVCPLACLAGAGGPMIIQ